MDSNFTLYSTRWTPHYSIQLVSSAANQSDDTEPFNLTTVILIWPSLSNKIFAGDVTSKHQTDVTTVWASKCKGAFETTKTVSCLLCFDIQFFLSGRGGWDGYQQKKSVKTVQWRREGQNLPLAFLVFCSPGITCGMIRIQFNLPAGYVSVWHPCIPS